ncbi:MAG: hypothetical protein MZV63_17150 [Marinilabiliales bacterium]|nr:hypothetical protein [Marinilabiliales bacterium]
MNLLLSGRIQQVVQEDWQGKNVVVSGAGTIGNLVAQFAKARGAKKVLITDVSDFKLKKARRMWH